MSALRPQGRPRRGATEVGREKIVSKLQEVFRSGEDVDLSRKTLAELAEVTPALISYYFPKKEILLEELSRPVICRYRREMEAVVFGLGADEVKLRNLISILVALYTKDGKLLDIYTDIMRKTGRSGDASLCEVTRMTTVVAGFFANWCGRPLAEGLDAAVLQGAVWGMCRFAARIEAEPSVEDDISPLVFRVVKLLSPSTIAAVI